MEQKICTYCGQTGHRASNCPHLRAAEACTELGIDEEKLHNGHGNLGLWLVVMIAIFSASLLALGE